MRVIMDNGGVRTHTVNDKAQISHGIEQKSSLSKRSGGTIENQQIRAVGSDGKAVKANETRGSPSVAAQRAEHFTKQSARSESTAHTVKTETRQSPQSASPKADKPPESVSRGAPSVAAQRAEHFTRQSARSESAAHTVKTETRQSPQSASPKADKPPESVSRGAPSVATQRAEHFTRQSVTSDKRNAAPEIQSVVHGSAKHTVDNAVTPQEAAIKSARSKALETKQGRTVGGKEIPAKGKRFASPQEMARRQEKFKGKQLKLAPKKNYKVIENGVVNTGEITKKKERTIYSQTAVKLKNAKLNKLPPQTFKIPKNQSERIREAVTIGKKRDFFKKKPKMPKPPKPPKIDRNQAELTAMAMGAGLSSAPKKHHISRALGGAKKVANVAKKPAEMLKNEFYKQADNSDDNGVKAVKLGVQVAEYGGRGVKTAAETGVKTVKKGAKITRRVYHKLHKTTSAEMRRTIRKRVFRNKLKTQVNYAAKQAVKKGAKAAGKATANAAKKAAQSAYKAAQATAKAVARAVAKIVSLIVETMPWSLIIIAAVLLVILIALMFGSMFSGAAGSVAGGGAWLVDDDENQTPEEIYEGYKEYIEQAKDVMQTQAKDALKNEVTSFCNSDTTTPRKIIEYKDKNNSRTFYPAKGADATINALIEQFGTEDYADYMSLLFVLMTREKQQADGNSDDTIYDFDFTKEDFEEFMKTVNENTCRWGDTFVIKTATESYGSECPSNCHRKTISGCQCCSRTNPETGRVTHYCGGHCPEDHTKLTVTIYTVKDYYGKEYSEIYNFTENEKTRYEASKAIIQAMLDYWEEQE